MSRTSFEARIKALLKLTRKPKASVAVTFVDDAEMARLNLQFRKKKGTTDVLSFQVGDEEGFLGDIVVSLDTAKLQARMARVKLDHLVCVLLVHGFLHLGGYDHATKRQKARMRGLESKLLKALIGSDEGLIALENKIKY